MSYVNGPRGVTPTHGLVIHIKTSVLSVDLEVAFEQAPDLLGYSAGALEGKSSNSVRL